MGRRGDVHVSSFLDRLMDSVQPLPVFCGRPRTAGTLLHLSHYNVSVRILVSAGEASGEMYGAQLIEALRRAAIPARVVTGFGPVPAGQSPATTQASQLEFFGAGGERMRAAGCEIVVDAKDLAVVGITEVLSHLPKIFGLYRKLLRAADEKRRVEAAADRTWDSVAEQVSRRYAGTPLRQLPQVRARYLQEAIRIISDGMDHLYNSETADELSERALSRVIERVATLMEMPGPMVAMELLRYRESLGKQ